MNVRNLNCFFVLIFGLLCTSSFAQTSVDSLLKKLDNEYVDTSRIKILKQLFDLEQDNSDKARKYLNEMMVLSEKTKSNEWITNAQVTCGNWYIINSDQKDSGIIIMKNLYERMSLQEYTFGIAKACKSLCYAFLYKFPDSALFYGLKSLDLFKLINNFDEFNGMKINLAVVYSEMKKTDEAVFLSKEALEYFEKTGNKRRAATASINTGNYYQMLGDYKNAIHYINKSIDYSTEINDVFSVAYDQAQLADVYCKENLYDTAYSFYIEVLRKGKEINRQYLLYRGYSGLSSIAHLGVLVFYNHIIPRDF